jgi:penicillin-binding protein 2
MQRYLEEWEKEDTFKRLRFFRIALVVLGSLILFRFWQLQVWQGDKWKLLATANQFRKVKIKASRGQLLDRNGKKIAGNRPGFNLTIIPKDANQETVSRLASVVGIPAEELASRIKIGKNWSPFVPVKVKENLSWEELSRLEEHIRELPGVDIEYQPIRFYPTGENACHILGYIGEISPLELQQSEYAGYQMGDYIGKAGVEKLYEKWLRGRDGTKFKIVDAQGRERSPEIIPGIKFEPTPPVPGTDVRLSIDLDLQELAQSLLAGKAGAIVMLKVDDGEVLVMASAPTFNPEVFSGPVDPEVWRALEDDPKHPLFNRPIQGSYPPGSTFKVVESLAGLEEKVIDPHTTFSCPGVFYLGNIAFHCWKKGGHGAISLEPAIIQSCDVFFYHLGSLLGIDRIAHYANLLGLGVRTGIGFANESAGLIPTSQWREQVRGEKWHLGDTISCAIGQGFIAITPLQSATMTMTIANEGRLYRPTLLKEVVGVPASEYADLGPKLVQKLNISEKTWKLVKEAMTGVVNTPGGTAFRGARTDKVLIAGKTGTAQVIKLKAFEGMSEGVLPEKYRDHAWFIAFAPADHPRVAMTVLVENGGHGASAAAPLARTMLEKYMELYPGPKNETQE